MLILAFLLFGQISDLEKEIADKIASEAISSFQKTGKFPEKINDASSFAGEMILPVYVGMVGRIKDFVTVKVLRIIDDQTMLVFMTDRPSGLPRLPPQTLIMAGIPTRNYADDDIVSSDKVFVISDIGRIGRVGGKYRVIEPVSDKIKNASTIKVNEFLRDVRMNDEKKQKAEEMRAAKEKKVMQEEKEMQEKAELLDKQGKAKELINKLVKGLGSAEKRFCDANKESNPQLAKQMVDQSEIYIKNSGKRLADAIKAMDAFGINKTEKNRLIAEANEAIAKAKKTVGIP